MGTHNTLLEMAIIFAGSSLLATLFLYLRQPIILAYIFLGVLAGPDGFGFLSETKDIDDIAQIGIVLLMFLLGLHLHPQKLLKLLKETSLITVGTSFVFALIGMGVAKAAGISWNDSLVVGLAMMFSSTVICLKLIPTTTLHHKHVGEMMISILLLQDIIAIILILFLFGNSQSSSWLFFLSTKAQHSPWIEGLMLIVHASLFTLGAFLFVTYGILKLFRKFDIIQDYIFLVSLGWCLLAAQAASMLGLSPEIGAFIAGITIGTSPIALIIAEGLKPVREFFLILFFFSIGARFDFDIMGNVLIPGMVLAIMLMVVKPLVFSWAFRSSQEPPRLANEMGIRLGQASEFSLLFAYGAAAAKTINPETAGMIQLATILTFIFSTYYVVSKYPTPIATNPRLRQD
jgi:Kef-type K+ transport system membrane component KefB